MVEIHGRDPRQRRRDAPKGGRARRGSLLADPVAAPNKGHGLLVDYPEAVIERLTEEHGMVTLDPTLGELPMTPAEHCSHCGKLNRKRSVLCAECNHYLKPKVDYGSLTDVAPYVRFGAPRVSPDASWAAAFIQMAFVM